MIVCELLLDIDLEDYFDRFTDLVELKHLYFTVKKRRFALQSR